MGVLNSDTAAVHLLAALDSRGGNCGGLPWLTPGRQVQGQWKDQRCTPSQSAFVIEHQPQDKDGHEFPGGEDGPVRVCQSVAAGPPSSRTGEATAGGRRPPPANIYRDVGVWGACGTSSRKGWRALSRKLGIAVL